MFSGRIHGNCSNIVCYWLIFLTAVAAKKNEFRFIEHHSSCKIREIIGNGHLIGGF